MSPEFPAISSFSFMTEGARNGEKHYIVQGLKRNENPVSGEDFDEVEIRRATKKEASRTLFLVRTE